VHTQSTEYARVCHAGVGHVARPCFAVEACDPSPPILAWICALNSCFASFDHRDRKDRQSNDTQPVIQVHLLSLNIPNVLALTQNPYFVNIYVIV